MLKYIDAGEIFKMLSEEVVFRMQHSDGRDFDVGRTNGIIIARNLTKGMPVADVAPVRRGEWSEHRRYDLTPSLNGFQCSACGQVEQRKTPFCPNCGADMRREEKK